MKGKGVDMFRSAVDDASELRLLEPHHAEEVFRCVDSNREELRQWLPRVDGARQTNDTRSFIAASLRKLAAQEELTAGVWTEGQFAGVVGVILSSRGSTGEIGYWLAREHQGKGLMTRTVDQLLPYMFEERGLNRAEIRCAPDNAKSCAIATRLGFQLEGTLREAEIVAGRWVDHSVYALLRSEWLAQRNTSRQEHS